jgi:hypothetical protein
VCCAIDGHAAPGRNWKVAKEASYRPVWTEWKAKGSHLHAAIAIEEQFGRKLLLSNRSLLRRHTNSDMASAENRKGGAHALLEGGAVEALRELGSKTGIARSTAEAAESA